MAGALEVAGATLHEGAADIRHQVLMGLNAGTWLATAALVGTTLASVYSMVAGMADLALWIG